MAWKLNWVDIKFMKSGTFLTELLTTLIFFSLWKLPHFLPNSAVEIFKGLHNQLSKGTNHVLAHTQLATIHKKKLHYYMYHPHLMTSEGVTVTS